MVNLFEKDKRYPQRQMPLGLTLVFSKTKHIFAKYRIDIVMVSFSKVKRLLASHIFQLSFCSIHFIVSVYIDFVVGLAISEGRVLNAVFGIVRKH